MEKRQAILVSVVCCILIVLIGLVGREVQGHQQNQGFDSRDRDSASSALTILEEYEAENGQEISGKIVIISGTEMESGIVDGKEYFIIMVYPDPEDQNAFLSWSVNTRTREVAKILDTYTNQ